MQGDVHERTRFLSGHNEGASETIVWAQLLTISGHYTAQREMFCWSCLAYGF